MIAPLTRRQNEIYDFIKAFKEVNGYTPTYCEIKENFGFKSTFAVQEHLKLMIKKGAIVKPEGKARVIILKERF